MVASSVTVASDNIESEWAMRLIWKIVRQISCASNILVTGIRSYLEELVIKIQE